MTKHTILFLAANPTGTDPLALAAEARSVQEELERSGYRDRFAFETRWAVRPLDLLRELRKLKPTVVHFSGHGGSSGAGARGAPGGTSGAGARGAPGGSSGSAVSGAGPRARREVVIDRDTDREELRGLVFEADDGSAKLVSTAALEETFRAAGASVQLVVLSACYSEPQAEALAACVDCVVGMGGAILDDAARSFAIGFYGGLGERESVEAAYRQGRAAIGLEGLRDGDLPRLKVREGIDASKLVLADDVGGRAAAGAAVALYERLSRVVDPLFEEIAFAAGVERPLFSPPTTPLATRAREVAEMARHDAELRKRLEDQLDRRAPSTRHGSAAPRADGAESERPGAQAPELLRTRLARAKSELDAILREHPRVHSALSAKVGCAPAVLVEGLLAMSGRAFAEAVFAVYDQLPAMSASAAEESATVDVLLVALPYVADLCDEVARCCAQGKGQADVIELPYLSSTIAEAVMAGWGDRRCRFEYQPGREPFGAAVVQAPATASAPVFGSTWFKDFVAQLSHQLGTGGAELDEQLNEITAELQLRASSARFEFLRYYFLFRDATPPGSATAATDVEQQWVLARRVLHGDEGKGQLASLVLVRMRGRTDLDQSAVNRRVAALRKTTP